MNGIVWCNDYQKENELLDNRFIPVANEGKCLLGYQMDRELTKEEIKDIKKFYLSIRYLQERDIEEEKVVLTKLPKDKITWY